MLRSSVMLVDDNDKNVEIIESEMKDICTCYRATKVHEICALLATGDIQLVLFNHTMQLDASYDIFGDSLVLVYSDSNIESLVDMFKQVAVLVDEASFDQLTGCYSRTSGMRRLNAIVNGTARVCFMMLDLDNLKTINDTRGHIFGDTVLKELARRIKSVIRRDTVFLRYGGDEFIIFFFCDFGAENVVKRVYEASRFKLDGYQVSASIGAWVGIKTSVSGMLKEADKLLYEAKRSGGDKYIMNRKVK